MIVLCGVPPFCLDYTNWKFKYQFENFFNKGGLNPPRSDLIAEFVFCAPISEFFS